MPVTLLARLHAVLAALLILATVPIIGAAAPAPVAIEREADGILVKFRDDAAATTAETPTARSVRRLGVRHLRVPAERLAARLAALRADPRVEYAEPNHVLRAAFTPTDPYYPQQWSAPKIELPRAWDVSRGVGVVVAVLDTGVDGGRPDLAGKVLAGHDFVTDQPLAAGANSDQNGHGTHVAGTVAAAADTVGIIGVAPGASILPVRVLDAAGSGSDADVANGIIYAADRGARVINLSLGGSGASTTLTEAVRYAVGRGVLVAAAAGNAGSTTPFYPAAIPEAIAVGATTSADQRASFSNHGAAWVDVAAPGVSILAPVPVTSCEMCAPGGYAYASGTSMATPIVAGLAALLVARSPGASVADLRARIETTTDATAGTGTAWRHGRINAARALDAAAATPTPTPSPTPVAALAAPVLVSPASWSSQATLRPTFTWKPVAGAVGYRLHVATSAAFETLLLDVEVGGTGHTPATDLASGGPRYWRVRAVGAAPAAPSAWSPAWVVKLPALPAPLPSAPLAGTPAAPVAFAWAAVPGATGYRVQISSSPTFASGVTTATVTGTSYTPPTWQKLQPGRAYTWRVQARNATGNGLWSVPITFTAP